MYIDTVAAPPALCGLIAPSIALVALCGIPDVQPTISYHLAERRASELITSVLLLYTEPSLQQYRANTTVFSTLTAATNRAPSALTLQHRHWLLPLLSRANQIMYRVQVKATWRLVWRYHCYWWQD